jgi:hypothetical protein
MLCDMLNTKTVTLLCVFHEFCISVSLQHKYMLCDAEDIPFVQKFRLRAQVCAAYLAHLLYSKFLLETF